MSKAEAFDCELIAARKALKALLAECRDGVAECFARGREETARLHEGTGNDTLWFAWHNTAADLMRASLAIADRFLGPPKITHHFTVETIAASGETTTREFAREQVLPFPRLPRVRGRPPRNIASTAAASENRRGAPRGNTNAVKHPRLRECQEACRRYRLLIRRICAAVTRYDALAAQIHAAIPAQPAGLNFQSKASTTRLRRNRRPILPRRTAPRPRVPESTRHVLSPRATGPPMCQARENVSRRCEIARAAPGKRAPACVTTLKRPLFDIVNRRFRRPVTVGPRFARRRRAMGASRLRVAHAWGDPLPPIFENKSVRTPAPNGFRRTN